jgi:hypothetical protein
MSHLLLNLEENFLQLFLISMRRFIMKNFPSTRQLRIDVVVLTLERMSLTTVYTDVVFFT